MDSDTCKSLVKKMSFTITAQQFEIDDLRACVKHFSDLYEKYLAENVTNYGADPDPVVGIKFSQLRAADACLMWSHESALSRAKEMQDES